MTGEAQSAAHRDQEYPLGNRDGMDAVHPASSKVDSLRFRRGLFALGVLNVVTFLAYTALSYGMAVLVPFEPNPIEESVFRRLAEFVQPLGHGVQAFLRGETALAGRKTFLAVYLAPLLISSAVFTGLLALLANHRQALDQQCAQLLLRWAQVFAVILMLAAPVLVEDFWLSPAWGRMVAHGLNPYYEYLTPAITSGLPLDHFGLRMTYGPLWALISGATMWVAGDSVLLAGGLFKLLLTGAWIASLRLIFFLLREHSPWHQCVGIALFGWLPLSLVETMAEGHNDVMLLLFVLLWIAALERQRPVLATLALAASVLLKYLSAPLFLLDFLHLARSRGRPYRAYALHAVIAATGAVVVLAFFYRSPQFFSTTAAMSSWHFFTPRDAVIALGRLLGVTSFTTSLIGILLIIVAALVQLSFILFAVAGVLRYWHRRTTEDFRLAVLSVWSGILFGIVGHVWPWFYLAAIGVAALVPGAPLAVWLIGVALAAPLGHIAWTAFGWSAVPVATVAMYAFAVLWTVVAPRRWLPPLAGFHSLPVQ